MIINRFFRGRWAYLTIGQILLAYLIIGCGSSKKDDAKAQQMKFEVIDSLLGPIYDVPKAGKSIRPPLNFVAIPDSILKSLQEQVKKSVGDSEGIELQQFFYNEPSGSGLMVSTVKKLNLLSDTTTFVNKYRRAINEAFGEPNVKAGDYWVGEVYVKNFLIMDSLNVKHQLLCISPKNDGLELEYFSSRQAYPTLVKLIESSIGSIKLTKNGG